MLSKELQRWRRLYKPEGYIKPPASWYRCTIGDLQLPQLSHWLKLDLLLRITMLPPAETQKGTRPFRDGPTNSNKTYQKRLIAALQH